MAAYLVYPSVPSNFYSGLQTCVSRTDALSGALKILNPMPLVRSHHTLSGILVKEAMRRQLVQLPADTSSVSYHYRMRPG